MTGMNDLVYVPDVSEFQPEIDDVALLEWSKAVIIRALYGSSHTDKAWYGGQRRDLLHKGGIRFLGIYQYIVKDQSVIDQARALAKLIGKLRPGEKLIGDLEEGEGDQHQRWLDWSAEIERLLGDKPWDYSGRNFAHDHNLGQVDWEAAYGQSEPGDPHKLWQFSSSYNVPGIGKCDCSIFHGTIDQLAALAFEGAPVVTTSSSGQSANPKPDCKAFQRAIRATIDNMWGPETDRNAQAVINAWARNFPDGIGFAQYVVGTRLDRVWGPVSVTALRDTTASAQRALSVMGFSPGAIDGVWGPKTSKAYGDARTACHI